MRPASLGLLKRDGTPPWLFETLHSLVLGQQRSTTGLAAIVRGEAPDGSGNPIIDTSLFLYKPGLPGNQLAYGGTAAGGNLTLSSTVNSTRGFIYFGVARTSGFDEVNSRIGIGMAIPTARLHILVPNPINEFAKASSGTASSIAIGHVDDPARVYIGGTGSPNGTVWEVVNDVGATSDGATSVGTADYDRWDFGFGLNGTLTLNLDNVGNIPDPGTDVGWKIHVTMRTAANNPAGPIMQLTVHLGGPSIFSGTVAWGNPGYTGGASEGNITASFARYTKNLTQAEAAQLRAGMGTQWHMVWSNAGQLATWDIAQCEIEVPAVGGGSAETLQKWETAGLSLDQLDFSDDGAGGTDLKLSGNSELYVNVGDASTGLRLYGLSSTAYIEAGTTAQAAMNLTLGGNRLAVGTLLTLNFTNTRLTGALQLNGATSGRLTMQAAAATTDYSLTWPAAQAGSTSFLSNTAGVLSWVASSGFASSAEAYVTIGNTAGLSAERALLGTANQIIVTDNGAVTGTVVLSAPQNLHTAAVFQVGTLGIGVAAAGGNFLDVAGIGRIRDTLVIDQQADRDALAIHYRALTMATGRPFRIIDDDAAVAELYFDPVTGTWVVPLLGVKNSAFTTYFVQGATTADRILTTPNLAGTLMLTNATQIVSGAITASGVWIFTSATRPLFKTGITIEDPGAGTNTISFIAPAAPTTHVLTWPGSNTSGVLTNDGSGILSWNAGVTPHALLSTSHSDSVANTVSRGSLIYGNSTPAWDELVKGTNGQVLMAGSLDVSWSDPDFSDVLFRVHDNLDATKFLAIQASGISTGNTRTWTVGNYSGIPVVPTNEGSSGHILISGGAGIQPTWGFGDIGNNARVAISKNSGATVGIRRRVNVIEGSNVTLTVVDDAGNEEVDVTIAAAGAAAADPAYSPGSFTVATETAKIMSNHLKLTGAQRMTLVGTARLRLTT